MKVILLQDVKKVGKKQDVVEVSDGYARNFLIANKLAVVYSDKSKQVLENQKIDEMIRQENLKKEAIILQEKLKDMKFSFDVNAKDGHVFNSISSKQISEELAKQSIIVDKKKFIEFEPISTLGITNVKVELYKGVIATLKIELKEAKRGK